MFKAATSLQASLFTDKNVCSVYTHYTLYMIYNNNNAFLFQQSLVFTYYSIVTCHKKKNIFLRLPRQITSERVACYETVYVK